MAIALDHAEHGQPEGFVAKGVERSSNNPYQAVQPPSTLRHWPVT